MPLYEYRCSKCDKVFEKLQRFSDAPLTVHEDCGGEVERLISTSGLHFKGSGWYVTDYARSGSASKKESGSDSSKSESKSADAKSSDSKTGDAKSSEAKASESKSSGTKTESKPAASTTSKTD